MRQKKSVFLLAAALLLAATSATAVAQTVLSMHIEEETNWVRNFNPFNRTSYRQSTMDFIYEPLVVFGKLQGNKPYYRLATAMSLADDLKAVTFDLRENVQWSDGQPFTADDVVFSFELMKKFPALDFNSIWQVIDGVEKLSPTKVKFTFKEPTALGPEKIVEMPIIAQHAWKDVADPVTFLNENPVGTGPMTEVTRFTPQVYEQCRNPHYWDAASLKVDCLRFPQIANNDQALAAATAGELDWFASFLPDIDKTYVASDKDHHGYWFPPGSLVAVIMNLESPDPVHRKAFDSVEFRRAVSMAMDRDAMVNVAGYGYPTLNDDPGTFGKRFESWADPKVKEQYGKYTQYDLEAAKALLDQAGFKDKDGDGFRDTPDGEKLSFDLIVPNGWTDWISTSQIAIEGLNQIGIDVKLATPDGAVWRQSLLDGKFDMALNSWYVGATPYYQMDDAFHSRNKGKTRFSAQRFFDPKLDQLLDAYTQTTDDAKRKDLLDQAQTLLAEKLPVVPIYNNPIWYEYNSKRFTGWATADNPFVSPQNYDPNHERLLHLLALRPVQ
ncbi:MAG TPA: ABC transporter substrate-binding protein [Inquilinus sp.]